MIKWSTNTSVTKIFSRDPSILPQRHEIPSILGLSAPTMRELHVLLNYPDTNFKKKVCHKNV